MAAATHSFPFPLALGLIKTTALTHSLTHPSHPFPNHHPGSCGKGPQPADMADDDDVETGRPAPKKQASAKKQPSTPAVVPPSAPEATAAAGGEMKEMQ